MTPAHIHLLLNHVPILGALFGTLLLLGGMARGGDELKRASLACFLISGLIAIPVFLSGRASDHLVNHVAGVVDDLIDPHEAAAYWSLGLALLLGLVSLGGLAMFRGETPLPTWLTGLCLVLGLVTSGSMSYTGLLGGQIHHPEVRPGWVPPPPQAGEESPPKTKDSASPGS